MDSSIESSGDDELLRKPLWKYVTILDTGTEAGGNISWKCKFCEKNFKSSYTRIRAHLLKLSGKGIGKCLHVQTKDLLEMEKLEQEASDRLKNNAPKNVPLPPCSSSMDSSSKKRRSGSEGISSSRNPIEKAFNVGAREELNHLIARMFYSTGLPFNLARNPYFQAAFTYAADNNIGGYLPPGYNSLRTTLLQKEKENIARLCAPIRAGWHEKGVSIAQPSSSSCAERNWSTYSFVHSVRRNKMTPKRAEDLVYIHSNLRLLSRKSPQYTQGESAMWDIAGDAFDTFEDVGMLEVATLSLDEPEMESNAIDENAT